MKKRYLAILLCAVTLALFTACGHEHEYGDWQVEKRATCERQGLRVRECDCGEAEEEKTPKLEHEYVSEEEKAPTCKQEGVMRYTCADCDDSYTENITIKTYTATELYDRYLGSVGEVVTYSKNGKELALGSCFVYTADGKIITNYHVIEDAHSAKITFEDTTYDVQKVLSYDKKIDLAVLQISAEDLTPVLLCNAEHEVGQNVYAFGNSRGLTSTFSDGIITYADRENDGVHYVQHDAPISGGNSGGPLINTYGEVVGINTLTIMDSQNLNFAVSVSELENLDYSKELTMQQFYDQEGNVYRKLANHIQENEDLEDGVYYLDLGSFYGTDYTTKFFLVAAYNPSVEEIMLGLASSEGHFTGFFIEEDLDGSYDWLYYDENGYEMSGTLRASSFSNNTTLTYSNHNIYNSALRTTVCNLATVMLRGACTKLTENLSDIGVTAADLVFTYY